MNLWYFWKQYQEHIDKVQSKVVKQEEETPPCLDRETNSRGAVSRFLYCLQQMPRAWGARPWSSHEIRKAGNHHIQIDLFRRKMKRDLDIR